MYELQLQTGYSYDVYKLLQISKKVTAETWSI